MKIIKSMIKRNEQFTAFISIPQCISSKPNVYYRILNNILIRELQ